MVIAQPAAARMGDIPDNGPVIVGVTWFLLLFCGVFLAVRLYAKVSRGEGFWWDDWILLFSWAMLLVESIMTHLGAARGFGKHLDDIDPQQVPTLTLYMGVVVSVSCLASTASKISFGATLLRLTFDWWRRFVWFAIITLLLVMIPSALGPVVQCTPAQKTWNNALPGRCMDASITIHYGIFNAAWCAAMDFALALLPWKQVARLQMQTRDRIGVAIALSMGMLSGICAIVKGVYVVQLRQEDFSYNSKEVTIWTAVETATAIIGASIPVLRVLVKGKLATPEGEKGDGYDIPLSRATKPVRPGAGSVAGGDSQRTTPGRSAAIRGRERNEHDDDDSDRSILRAVTGPGQDRPAHADEFAVEDYQAIDVERQ